MPGVQTTSFHLQEALFKVLSATQQTNLTEKHMSRTQDCVCLSVSCPAHHIHLSDSCAEMVIFPSA